MSNKTYTRFFWKYLKILICELKIIVVVSYSHFYFHQYLAEFKITFKFNFCSANWYLLN